MNQPLVTTIIPSFNHARFIGQAIESVLAQDYPHIELIVIDDGSSDDSHEVIRSYAARHPGIVAMLNRENHGQSWVLNRAIERSRGEFIQILPSDDWYFPHKTRVQVEKFMAGPDDLGVVYGRGYRYFEDTGKTLDWTPEPMLAGDVQRALIERGNFIYPVTPMFRRACFEREPLDESYRAEGEAVYPRFARHFLFDYVDEFVVTMRDHSYNIGKDAVVMYHELNRYYDRVFADPALPDDLRALETKVRARHHRTKGLQLVRSGRDRKLGRESLLAAVRLKPGLLADWRILAGLATGLLPSLPSREKRR